MAEPRWLTAAEQDVWRLYWETSQRLLARLARELGDDTPVSMAEYDVLVKLSEAPDRTLRMSELASRTTQSRSRMAHTVARMECDGQVVRSKSESDGRGVVATLTEDGLELLRKAAPSHVESVRRHFIDLLDEDDLACLNRVLGKMVTHLREVDPNHAPFNPVQRPE